MYLALLAVWSIGVGYLFPRCRWISAFWPIVALACILDLVEEDYKEQEAILKANKK